MKRSVQGWIQESDALTSLRVWTSTRIDFTWKGFSAFQWYFKTYQKRKKMYLFTPNKTTHTQTWFPAGFQKDGIHSIPNEQPWVLLRCLDGLNGWGWVRTDSTVDWATWGCVRVGVQTAICSCFSLFTWFYFIFLSCFNLSSSGLAAAIAGFPSFLIPCCFWKHAKWLQTCLL